MAKRTEMDDLAATDEDAADYGINIMSKYLQFIFYK